MYIAYIYTHTRNCIYWFSDTCSESFEDISYSTSIYVQHIPFLYCIFSVIYIFSVILYDKLLIGADSSKFHFDRIIYVYAFK